MSEKISGKSQSKAADSKPIIYEFLDYREFLQANLEFLKTRLGMTKMDFLKQIGFKSTSYLSMILDRQRNIKASSARRIGYRLGLKATEVDFLQTLVAFNDAKDSKVKDAAYQRLLGFRKFREIRTTAESEYAMFKAWFVIAVLEAVGTSWMQKPLNERAAAFGITPSQLKEALGFLEDLSLIKKDGTQYVKRDRATETPPELQSVHARNYHRQMIYKALQAIDTLGREERQVEGLTISLSEEKYREVREKISKFRRELNAEYSDDPSPDKVYQINFQSFPLGKLN